MAVIDLRNTTLQIRDGTPTTPLVLEMKIGEGNLTYSERRTMGYRRERGLLGTVRQEDEEPMEVSFDFEWEFLRSDGAEPISVEEALKQIGGAAAWVSTSADPCEPYAVDIVITYEPPCSEAKNEVIVLEDFRWETLDHNLREGQVSCKGQCNATEALVTRVAPVGAPQEGARMMNSSVQGRARQKEIEARQEKERETYERIHSQNTEDQDESKNRKEEPVEA